MGAGFPFAPYPAIRRDGKTSLGPGMAFALGTPK
jgi:hypothetical protein